MNLGKDSGLKNVRSAGGVIRTSAAFLALLLSGCAPVQRTAVFFPQTSAVTPGKTVDLHSETDPPIHLGDNRGAIDDIPLNLLNPDAPEAYGWKFSVLEAPKSATVTVKIYSLAPGTGCNTMVRLNGKDLANLTSEPGAGRGVTTTKVISIKMEQFKMGLNELVISEDECVGSYRRPTWNDSLIYAVRLELRD